MRTFVCVSAVRIGLFPGRTSFFNNMDVF